ncbi:hypothetical protein SVI_0520 [Shewanella violacea DSS12]|uniref:Uncharacterized protein n=1 Tax=Shewanella violacea (strain JCM 10179 / CIP 106290 / LMG 19151 / DSS12) TaxID=637905 RepID=D4ZFP2_SHEVD|nr:hypothetical protein SVI_0520 [Shewanella violacea DSS12]
MGLEFFVLSWVNDHSNIGRAWFKVKQDFLNFLAQILLILGVFLSVTRSSHMGILESAFHWNLL